MPDAWTPTIIQRHQQAASGISWGYEPPQAKLRSVAAGSTTRRPRRSTTSSEVNAMRVMKWILIFGLNWPWPRCSSRPCFSPVCSPAMPAGCLNRSAEYAAVRSRDPYCVENREIRGGRRSVA